MSEVMTTVTTPTALEMLHQIKTELYSATCYMVVGQPLDGIDREHLSKAALLVEMLYNATRGAA